MAKILADCKELAQMNHAVAKKVIGFQGRYRHVFRKSCSTDASLQESRD
jgi:hypothetical protein